MSNFNKQLRVIGKYSIGDVIMLPIISIQDMFSSNSIEVIVQLPLYIRPTKERFRIRRKCNGRS